jgi:dUTP pyrophosphatase
LRVVDMPDIVVKYVGGVAPTYQTVDSAGCDVSALEEVVIPAGKWAMVPTGLKMEIPKGYECQIRSRSGLAAKEGVFVLNGVGTIDSDYRGEIKVLLANMGMNDYHISPGDRIAQMVFAPINQVSFKKVGSLSTSERGSGGFGSTGS